MSSPVSIDIKGGTGLPSAGAEWASAAGCTVGISGEVRGRSGGAGCAEGGVRQETTLRGDCGNGAVGGVGRRGRRGDVTATTPGVYRPLFYAVYKMAVRDVLGMPNPLATVKLRNATAQAGLDGSAVVTAYTKELCQPTVETPLQHLHSRRSDNCNSHRAEEEEKNKTSLSFHPVSLQTHTHL